jgi:hypothetical protein
LEFIDQVTLSPPEGYKDVVRHHQHLAGEYHTVQYNIYTRAGLCPWDNRGKANSCRPPPPIRKNLQKKAKLCNIVTATSLLN